jgi:hypothetical protein
VVNVQPTTDGITEIIGTDEALGCIDNAGISNALRSKLAAAQAAIDAGKIQEAINILNALLNQLNAQADKHIKTTCIDSNGNPFNPVTTLIADVKALLASLSVTLKADPIMGSVITSTNSGLAGARVNILNSSKKVVSTAVADVTGFYYFPLTSNLAVGATYTAKVVLPRGYRSSTPVAQTFTWRTNTVLVNNFVLK